MLNTGTPSLDPKRRLERALVGGSVVYRLAVRDDHVLELQLEQVAERGEEEPGPEGAGAVAGDEQVDVARMGQANVKRWVPEIMSLLLDGDPLGVDGFASHHLPLGEAPDAYEKFQKKEDGYVKVVLRP